MKFGSTAVLVILNSLNGSDHNCGAHMNRKQQKTRLGSMDVKTVYENNR